MLNYLIRKKTALYYCSRFIEIIHTYTFLKKIRSGLSLVYFLLLGDFESGFYCDVQADSKLSTWLRVTSNFWQSSQCREDSYEPHTSYFIYFIMLLGTEPGALNTLSQRSSTLSCNSAFWDEIILSKAGQFSADRTVLIPVQMRSVIVYKCRKWH